MVALGEGSRVRTRWRAEVGLLVARFRVPRDLACHPGKQGPTAPVCLRSPACQGRRYEARFLRLALLDGRRAVLGVTGFMP